MSKQVTGFLNQHGWMLMVSAFLGVLCLTLMATPSHCQLVARPGPPKVIDAATQAQIIDSVCAALNDTYVFADVAKKIENFIRKQYRNKAYQNLTDMLAFTQQLTQDIRSINNDRHLNILYIESGAPGPATGGSEQQAAANYQFEKVEHLPGNVGYLKFNEFVAAEEAGPTAVAAMNFLGHSDALIIDLRDNVGGATSMIQLITSYFFDHSVHLNDFYIRKTDTTRQYWTTDYVDGLCMANVDLYILTSSFSFSAAEEFSYDLQNLKRATIVGEVTGGGAHPVTTFVFPSLGLTVFVPYGRAINPITGTNWEGVGVKPDIEVTRDKAFDVAYGLALKKLSDKIEDPIRKAVLTWLLDGQEALANPMKIGPEILKDYVGTYGARMITLENNELYYQREGRPRFRLIPMATDKFALDGLDNFRVQFVRDGTGSVVEFVGMYDDGHTDRTPKTR
jgi:retinol-binding protein 3